MNLRLFTIALLISALPAISSADPAVSLNKGDFIAAEKVTRDGETIVSVRLSKSGKAKIKKLGNKDVGKAVHARRLIRGRFWVPSISPPAPAVKYWALDLRAMDS
jgi:hypothetical protein